MYACPVVGRRELNKQQRAHRERLQNMKSALDTRAPAPQPHLTLYGRDYVAKKRATTEAAFSDLKMIQSIARTMTRDHSIPERKGPISLNADGRKQEIYRIMKENHKLLDSIENCEPMLRTQDMVKADRFRKRYTINCSHSMRLSGEYDDEILRIKDEERRKLAESKRIAQLRFEKSERMARTAGGSVSLPSLSPNGQRGAGTEKPSSSPSKTPQEADSSSSNGYKPSSAPEHQAESAETEPVAASQSATGLDDAMPEQRQPVRFDIEETEGAEEIEGEEVAADTRAHRTATPHVGSINLDDYRDGETELEDTSESKKKEASEEYEETFEAEDQTFEDEGPNAAQ